MQTSFFEPLTLASSPVTDSTLSFEYAVEINQKWVNIKESLTKTKTELTNTIAENFKNKSFRTWRALFSEFQDQLGLRVISTYSIIADLNHIHNENSTIVASNPLLREFSPSLQNALTKLNSSLLQITLHPFQGNIHLEPSELLGSISGIDDQNSLTKIVYFKANERLPPEIERVLGKRIAEKDLISIMNVFKEKTLAVIDKKTDLLEYSLKNWIEQQFTDDVFEQLQMIINKVIAKISYILSLRNSGDPELVSSVEGTMSEFFLKNYPILVAEFNKFMELCFSEDYLLPIIEEATKNMINELSTRRESTSNKYNLHQLFIFEQIKVTYNSVLPICIRILKEAKTPKKIEVKSFIQEKQRIEALELPIFQLNYVYFTCIKTENSDQTNDDEGDEYIAFTNDSLEVEKKEKWQLQLDFLPLNLEISRHEGLILYFFAKLGESTVKTVSAEKKQELLANKGMKGSGRKSSAKIKKEDDDSLPLEVAIQDFFAFFFNFLKALQTPDANTDIIEEGVLSNESMLSTHHFVTLETQSQNGGHNKPKDLANQHLRYEELKTSYSQAKQSFNEQKHTIAPYMIDEESTFNKKQAIKKSFLPGDEVKDYILNTEACEINSLLDDFPGLALKNAPNQQQAGPSFVFKESESLRTSISESQAKQSGLELGGLIATRVKTAEMLDNLQIFEMIDTDRMWESCDKDIFQNLLENGTYKFFNDIISFKEICGSPDYLFIDKKASAEIFKEFSAHARAYPNMYSKKSSFKQDTLKNPETQRALSNFSADITKGIVLLLAPSHQSMNLITIKVNLALKTKTVFVIDYPSLDANVLKDLFNKLLRFLKHTLMIKNQIHSKFSKFKEHLVCFNPSSEHSLMNAFTYFYFPYMKLVRDDYLSSSETLNLQTLKEALFTYLNGIYDSKFGIENFKNLRQMYQLFYPRFESEFIIDEFKSFEGFLKRAQQYLETYFVDNIEAHNLKSILLLAKIYNEKNRCFDFILLFFEYKNSASDGIDESMIAITDPKDSFDREMLEYAKKSKRKTNLMQNLYVFGDTYGYLLQVRNLIKSFLIKHEEAVDRIKFCFCQMDKAKSRSNLFFVDRTILYCIVSILLNEGLQIQDVLAICRVSPSAQYNYFCMTLEKVRTSSQKESAIPKAKSSLQITTHPEKLRASKALNLIEETQQTLENLGLVTHGSLRMQVDSMNAMSTVKKVVAYMVPFQNPSSNNSGIFGIDSKNLCKPNEPFTMVIVNKFINPMNNNICNVLEPDGTTYIVRIASEESQMGSDKLLSGTTKSIDEIRKMIPRMKTYKSNINKHMIVFKNLSWDSIQSFIDFIVMLYLQKYKSSKDFRLIVSENSILSLVLAESKFYAWNSAKNFELISRLKAGNSIMLEPDFLIAHTSNRYQDDYLNALLAMLFTSSKLNKFVFCIQSDMEYTFHILVKDEKASGKILGIFTSLKDHSNGVNAKNYYDDLVNLLQRDLFERELQFELSKIELDMVPSFLYAADPNLLLLGITDVIKEVASANVIDVLKNYFECWHRPSLLSGQLMGLCDRLKPI